MASAIGQTFGYTKKDDGGGVPDGPTMGPTTKREDEEEGAVSKIGLPASYKPFAVTEGPLAETMRTIATQERELLLQASRCRVAMARLDMLQKIMASRACTAKEEKEVERWKMSAQTMQKQLKNYLATAGKEVADLLGEKSLGAVNKDLDTVRPCPCLCR